MQPRRLRPALLAALAALLLAAGALAPAQASASEEPPDGETITTVLHSGWNMVGWVGPETSVAELFEVLPQLRRVSAWDAREGAFLRAFRDDFAQLASLTPGMGLWLHIEGDATVEWTRLGRSDGAVARLQAGLNLVGVVADGAVTAPDNAEARAWRWDPVGQQYETYRFGDATLSGGDALWIEAAAPFNLWQPGTEPPPIAFLGDISAQTRADILAEYQEVRAFFSVRFAASARGRHHHIGATIDDIRTIFRAVFGEDPDPRPEVCGRTDFVSVDILLARCAQRFLASHYVDVLTVEISGKGRAIRGRPRLDPRGPGWLIKGVQTYALAAYNNTLDEADFRGAARRTALPLRAFELTENRSGALNNSEAALGFLAAERLVERAGEPALFEYFRLMRDTSAWRDAFEAAFGISADAFYAAFARYRSEAFPPHAHLTDGREAPIIIVLDGVPSETASAVHAEFENVHRFFADRFEAEATEFTLYIARNADDALAAVPGWHDAHTCRRWPLDGVVVLTQQWCGDTFPLGYVYIGGIVRELVYKQPIPPSGVAYGFAPSWFDSGTVQYAEVAYGEAAGTLTPGEFHDLAVTAATHAPVTLEDLVDPIGAREAGTWRTKALGFLAVEWLAEYAGDPAVFEYYRVLPSSPSREAAFEHAFGLTLEDFYERFEAYRAELAAQ